MNARRFFSISFLFLLAACDGGGCSSKDKPDPGVADGKTNGACRGTWNSCDDLYTECRRGVCRSCGGDGQHYCVTTGPGETPCQPGLVQEGGSGICRSTCGKLGQPCCKAYGLGYECSGTASCDSPTNKCVGKAPLCASGPNPIAVTCHLANHCALSVVGSYASASVDEAKACVQKAQGCDSVDQGEVKSFKFCFDYPYGGETSIEVSSTDEPSALQCAQSQVAAGSTQKPCPSS